MTEPTTGQTTDATRERAQFRRNLIRVMAVQVVALALLWWLQATFTH